jgi:hypothetical protein
MMKFWDIFIKEFSKNKNFQKIQDDKLEHKIRALKKMLVLMVIYQK